MADISFTPQSDSPLYGSPALSEVLAEDSSSVEDLPSMDDATNLSRETEYIVTPSES